MEEIYDGGFIPFTDDFMFTLVMDDSDLCKDFLNVVLPQEQIGEVRMPDGGSRESTIENLSVKTQKSLKFEKDMHGVRFDAFIQSEGLWAEVEMQTADNSALGKRSRYYQSNMDLDCLNQGEDYRKLKRCYVIFICTFDYFGLGAPVYHFQHWDCENCLPLDDESYIILLNTACSPDKVPEGLKELYDYITNPKEHANDSPLTKKIHDRVQKYNSKEWRKHYMTLEYLLKEKEQNAREEGLAEGFVEGKKLQQLETVLKLKELGMDSNTIADVTGLSLEEIEKL